MGELADSYEVLQILEISNSRVEISVLKLVQGKFLMIFVKNTRLWVKNNDKNDFISYLQK